MSDLPVQHYLGIYEARLSRVERGISHPTAQVVAGMKRLVVELRALNPEEKIHLDANVARAIFTRSSTGDLVAQIDFDEPKA